MTRPILHGPRDPNLIDAILRTDPYCFLQATFPIVSQGPPLVKNWHLEAMAHSLEQVRLGITKRLIITVPPRSLKSIMASVAFPAFVLGHDPARRLVCVSYAESLAKKHADDCRLLMSHPFYRRLFPGTVLRRETQHELATTRGGTRLTTSVGGTLTGRGGNIIILDDPIKPQDAHSVAVREHVNQWFRNTLVSRLDNKSSDAIIIVMQRVHIDDLVGHVLEFGDWHILNLPAIAELREIIPLSPFVSHTRAIGDLLHPAREPMAVLDNLKRDMGTLDFSAQYQQQPVPIKGNIVQWEWFKTYDHLPPYKPEDYIIVSWDTAQSAKELADYSAGVVLYVQGEKIYVLDVIRERLTFPELKRRVIEVHQSFHNRTDRYALVIEDMGSGMSLIQELKSEGIYPVAFRPDEGDKVVRLSNQTARLESGVVHLPRQADWLTDFKAELMAFPGGRHDDQVDAFSQAMIYDRKMRRRGIVVRPAIGHY